MLNLDLIDNLYASLSKEKQAELNSLLFKRSKQTVTYFHRQKDISLSKLETLADFFQMPLDFFRLGSRPNMFTVHGSNNKVGNLYVNTNLMFQIELLQKEIESLKSENVILKDKDKLYNDNKKTMEYLLAAKDDIINNLKKEKTSTGEGQATDA